MSHLSISHGTFPVALALTPHLADLVCSKTLRQVHLQALTAQAPEASGHMISYNLMTLHFKN